MSLLDTLALRRGGKSARISACKRLGESQDKSAVRLLCETVREGDTEVALAAIAALGEIREPSAIEPLSYHLDHYSDDMRAAARNAILAIGGEEALVEAAVAQLRGGKQSNYVKLLKRTPLLATRKLAERITSRPAYGKDLLPVLADVGGSDAVPHVIDALWDRELAYPAASILKGLDDRAVCNLLVPKMGSASRPPDAVLEVLSYYDWRPDDRNERIRWALQTGQISFAVDEGEFALAPLIEALSSSDNSTKVNAITALGELGESQALGPITKTFSDWQSSERVKVAAAHAIGRLGDASSAELLLSNVNQEYWAHSRNDRLSDSCVAALRQLGPAATSTIANRIGYPRHRRNMIHLLGHTRDPQAARILIGVIETGSREDSDAATCALKELGEVAVPSLSEALRHEKWYVRNCAFWLLNEVGWRPDTAEDRTWLALQGGKPLRSECVPTLLEVLGNHPDPKLREKAAAYLTESGRENGEVIDGLIAEVARNPEAVRSLAKIGGDKAFNVLVSLLDTDPARAAEALGDLGDVRAVEPLISRLATEWTAAAAKTLVKLDDVRAVAVLARHLPGHFDNEANGSYALGHLIHRHLLQVLEARASEVAHEGLEAILALPDILSSEHSESWWRETGVGSEDYVTESYTVMINCVPLKEAAATELKRRRG